MINIFFGIFWDGKWMEDLEDLIEAPFGVMLIQCFFVELGIVWDISPKMLQMVDVHGTSDVLPHGRILHGILTSVRWDQTHTTMLLQPKQISGIIRYHKHSYWKWWFSIVFCMFTRSYPLFWTNKPSGVIKHGNRESASNVLMIFPAVNYRTQNLSKWRFLGKNHVFSLK